MVLSKASTESHPLITVFNQGMHQRNCWFWLVLHGSSCDRLCGDSFGTSNSGMLQVCPAFSSFVGLMKRSTSDVFPDLGWTTDTLIHVRLKSVMAGETFTTPEHFRTGSCVNNFVYSFLGKVKSMKSFSNQKVSRNFIEIWRVLPIHFGVDIKIIEQLLCLPRGFLGPQKRMVTSWPQDMDQFA